MLEANSPLHSGREDHLFKRGRKEVDVSNQYSSNGRSVEGFRLGRKVDSLFEQACLGGHPKPASEGHLKTGQL